MGFDVVVNPLFFPKVDQQGPKIVAIFCKIYGMGGEIRIIGFQVKHDVPQNFSEFVDEMQKEELELELKLLPNSNKVT